MPRSKTARLAQQRRRSTNETFEQAYQALVDLPPDTRSLPAAKSAEQRHFEADVFAELVHGYGHITEFPFGIRRTHPGIETLRLEVESERVGDILLAHLLPACEPDDEVRGLAGLRIKQHAGHGVELHRLGQQTSVWLTGLPERVWRAIEARHTAHITQLGWQLCWQQLGSWTATEVEFDETWGRDAWMFRFREGGWFTSGLLRRLPIFHTVVVPHTVSAWHTLGGTAHWKMELVHAPTSAYRVTALLEALTSPETGLPVRVYGQWPASEVPDEPGIPVRVSDEARTGILEMLFCRWANNLNEHDPQRYDAIEARIARVEGSAAPAAGADHSRRGTGHAVLGRTVRPHLRQWIWAGGAGGFAGARDDTWSGVAPVRDARMVLGTRSLRWPSAELLGQADDDALGTARTAHDVNGARSGRAGPVSRHRSAMLFAQRHLPCGAHAAAVACGRLGEACVAVVRYGAGTIGCRIGLCRCDLLARSSLRRVRPTGTAAASVLPARDRE